MTNSWGIVPHFKINTHMEIQRVWYSAQRQDREKYLKWDINICNDGHDPYEIQVEWNSLDCGWWFSIFMQFLAFVMTMMRNHRRFVRWFFKWTSTYFWWFHVKNRLCLWSASQHKSIKSGLQKKKILRNLRHEMDLMMGDELHTSHATNLGTGGSI